MPIDPNDVLRPWIGRSTTTNPDDPNVIDMGPVKLVRSDGDSITIVNRYGEEAIGYLERVLGGTDWVPDETDSSGEREVEIDADAEWEQMRARWCGDPLALVHVVQFGEEHFTVQHPMTERGPKMHECPLHQWISDLGGPPADIEMDGAYIATPVDPVVDRHHAPWRFTYIGEPCRVCGYAQSCGEPAGEDCHS